LRWNFFSCLAPASSVFEAPSILRLPSPFPDVPNFVLSLSARSRTMKMITFFPSPDRALLLFSFPLPENLTLSYLIPSLRIMRDAPGGGRSLTEVDSEAGTVTPFPDRFFPLIKIEVPRLFDLLLPPNDSRLCLFSLTSPQENGRERFFSLLSFTSPPYLDFSIHASPRRLSSSGVLLHHFPLRPTDILRAIPPLIGTSFAFPLFGFNPHIHVLPFLFRNLKSPVPPPP